MSTSSKPQLTTEQIQKTRKRFERFRILVIGRANAGKTTILRAVCNTTDDPMIFDPKGNQIESAILDPSLKRGEHNIENEMIFEGNPGFVFHDSRGFEAGGDGELKLVQQFLQERSKARNVNEQLHAIWYCIPTTDDRPITAAEKKFFNECGTGLVPVIVLWTKTEALDLAKIKQLMKEGKSKADAKQEAPEKAWADFERNVYQRFAKFKYQPKAYVVFRKMHEAGGNCDELIEQTAKALSSEELQQLLVSTQQKNLNLCVEYGIRITMRNMERNGSKMFKTGNWTYFILNVLTYFPNIYEDEEQQAVKGAGAYYWSNNDRYEHYYRYGQYRAGDAGKARRELSQFAFTIMSDLLPGLSTKFNCKDATYCIIVSAIIGYLAFFLNNDSQSNSFKDAVQAYQKSPYQASVKQAIEHLFQEHHHFNQRILGLFKHSYKTALVEGAIKIALDNCLSSL